MDGQKPRSMPVPVSTRSPGCVYLVGILLLALLISVLPGCTGHNYAPVKDLEKPKKVTWGSHRVQPGETLYYIAWRYGRDYRQLAAINNIPSPYLIRPGEYISLKSRPTYSRNKVKTQKTSTSSRASRTSTAYRSPPGRIRWSWPLRGPIVGHYTGTGVTANKGIDIKADPGSTIKAAADGIVVYSGNGLIGYGNLVIIKHNETYLSAYAHNRKIFVREKNNVKEGQKIAEIGSTGASITKLHFEIRKNGKPVNPLNYLPKN